MVVASSTRCRAKEGDDRDGVLRVAVLGGTGMEGGDQLSVVMKFGGSSVSSAARMEVAGLILAFSEERPVVVLSAMGKTTNLLLLAGEKAVGCGVIRVSEIEEWNMLKDLHIKYVYFQSVTRGTILRISLDDGRLFAVNPGQWMSLDCQDL